MSLKIRLSLPNTQAVIIATAVLHNICRQINIVDVESEIKISSYETVSTERNQDEEGLVIGERQDLINNYFGRYIWLYVTRIKFFIYVTCFRLEWLILLLPLQNKIGL